MCSLSRATWECGLDQGPYGFQAELVVVVVVVVFVCIVLRQTDV